MTFLAENKSCLGQIFFCLQIALQAISLLLCPKMPIVNMDKNLWANKLHLDKNGFKSLV